MKCGDGIDEVLELTMAAIAAGIAVAAAALSGTDQALRWAC